MSLKIDGRAQDTVTVPTNQLAFYSLSAYLTPGTHQLAVSFDNDAYSPPEDRNLFLAQILWGRDSDNSPTSLLTQPGAVAQVRRGNGLILLDEVCWETESQNATKAGRFACELLTGLGAAARLSPALGIQAVTMSNVNVSAYYVSGGIVWLGSNGRIETPVSFTTPGAYTFQVVAGGTAALGVLPQVAIVVDGVTRPNFFLTSTNMTPYTITLSITAGTHTIGLAFLNDYWAPPDDRNAAFSLLTITPPTVPRLTALDTDPLLHVATLQWEGIAGKTYEVQLASNLLSRFQAVAVVTNNDSVASWQDTGGAWGTPPLRPTSPQRYYRIRQTSP